MKKLYFIITILLFLSSCEKNEFDKKSMTENNTAENHSNSEEIRILYDEYTYKDYRVELYDIKNPKDEEKEEKKRELIIYKNDSKVYEISEWSTTFLEIAKRDIDITGNGEKNLVITNFTGGAHCCFQLVLLELGSEFKELLNIGNDVDPVLKDIDGDWIYEVIHRDNVFNYWHTSFAESYMPEYILRYKNGKYILATNLMKKPEPSIKELRGMAKWTILDNSPWISGGDYFDNPELFQIMLDLIYSGNIASAWAYLDMTWPETKPGKDQFKKDFLKQLSKLDYWVELKALNGM